MIREPSKEMLALYGDVARYYIEEDLVVLSTERQDGKVNSKRSSSRPTEDDGLPRKRQKLASLPSLK